MAQVTEEQPLTIKKKDIIVQYLIVRRDLLEELKWPTGSVISQACHASVAGMYEINIGNSSSRVSIRVVYIRVARVLVMHICRSCLVANYKKISFPFFVISFACVVIHSGCREYK